MPRLKQFLLMCFLTLPVRAFAAQEIGSAGGEVVKMLLGLGVVLLGLFGAMWLLKRLQAGGANRNLPIKVLGAASVGQRERVVLVSVGEKVLVLGVCPGRISALHTMNADEFPQTNEPVTPTPSGEFADRLRNFIQSRGRHAQ